MADLESALWSETAASNTAPSPDGWPPNSSPNIVYTTDREIMGALKRDWNRRNATVTAGGTANALTLTFTQNPTALIQGQRYAFIAAAANTGPATLQVGSLAATAIQANGAALVGGEMRTGLITEVIYTGSVFAIIAGSGAGSGAYLPLIGGTVTGNVVIKSANPVLGLNKTVTSGADNFLIGQTNGLARWSVDLGNNTAESAGAGSDFGIGRYNDAGSLIDSPIVIARNTGAVTFSSSSATFVQAIKVLGIQTHAGTAGAYGGNTFNIMHGTGQQLWIDTTSMGTIAYTSDYRTKRDIAPLPSMWERIKALKPISYRHKDFSPPWASPKEYGSPADPLFRDDDKERWGFVAHELQEALIEDAASGHKDEANLIQSPNPWTVIATLTKALQEAMARIEKLEARLPLAPETA